MKVRWLCVEPSKGSCRKTSTQYFEGMPPPGCEAGVLAHAEHGTGVAAFCFAFSMACVQVLCQFCAS